MRVKGITVLGLGLSLMSSALLAQENPAEPDFDTVKVITVDDGNSPGWYGEFKSDGSAKLLRRGAEPVYRVAVAPAGSLSIKQIYDLVAPHLKRPPADKKEVLNIIFQFDSSSTNRETEIHFYIEDKRVMRKLMHGLRDKVVPWVKPSFEEFLSQYPLVPGDEPAPFRYDSKMNISKWLYGGILAALCVGAVLWFIRKKK